MPKSEVHKFLGTTTGTFVAFEYGQYFKLEDEYCWQLALGGAIGGYTTARIADKLEPSEILGPNHRGAIHSIALNGLSSYLAYNPAKNLFQSLIDKANKFDNNNEHFNAFLCRLAVGFLIGAIGGHASHLLLDSGTHKGLPFLS